MIDILKNLVSINIIKDKQNKVLRTMLQILEPLGYIYKIEKV